MNKNVVIKSLHLLTPKESCLVLNTYQDILEEVPKWHFHKSDASKSY